MRLLDPQLLQLFFVSDIPQADYMLETVPLPSLRTFIVLVAIPTYIIFASFVSRYQSSVRGVDESACLIDYKFSPTWKAEKWLGGVYAS
jgi:hypothetical protein